MTLQEIGPLCIRHCNIRDSPTKENEDITQALAINGAYGSSHLLSGCADDEK